MYLYYFLVLILTTQKPIFCEVRVIAFKLIFILCEPYFAGSQVQFLFGQLDADKLKRYVIKCTVELCAYLCCEESEHTLEE